MSFIRRKKQFRFTPAVLEESNLYLRNPSCGWYRIYPFAIEKNPDFEELYWCLSKEETLALVIVDIGAFRDGAISEDALRNLADILEFFKINEKEIILRITYDREGHGMEREPEFLRTVQEHMRQLATVLSNFMENLFVVQGVLIGSWGEMHDSKFLSKERLRQLMETWQNALGKETAIVVRTPQQWRFLHTDGTKAGTDRIGLFDDGIFGSPDHLGTYGVLRKEEADWQDMWCREDELEFVGQIGACIPYGGEAVGLTELSLEEMVEELRKTGVSYLNRTHDVARLEQWQKTVWQETGVFHGMNGLDYIGCHLGYRFVVRKVELVGKKTPYLRILIENTGFSTMKEEAELLLSWEKEPLVLPDSLCGIPANETKEIMVLLPEQKEEASGSLSLSMRRKRDGRPIFFANTNADNGVLLGLLSNS